MTKIKSVTIYKYFEILLIIIHIIPIIILILGISGFVWSVGFHVMNFLFSLPLHIMPDVLPEIAGSFVYYIVLFFIPLIGLFFFWDEGKKIHFSLMFITIISAFFHYSFILAITRM